MTAARRPSGAAETEPQAQAAPADDPQEAPPAVKQGFTADAPRRLPPSRFYVALADLFVGGTDAVPARAFAPGDRVPAAHVERFGWHDQVAVPPGPEGE